MEWELICNERIIEDAMLSITLDNDYLKATIEYTLDFDKLSIKVIEKLGIQPFQGYFHMQGYEYQLEPPIDDMQYADSSFELEFLGDDILIGSDKCAVGYGKALFFRVTV